MKTLYMTCYTIMVAVLLVSCEQFLDIPGPENQLLKSNVFEDDRTATAAIVGIYSNISAISSPLSATIHLAAGLSSDELAVTGNDIGYKNLQMNTVQPDNEIILNVWTHLYQNVYYANTAIEALQVSTGISDSVKTRLLGEAMLVRAFCFYFLVNLWGGVPLITGTDYLVNQSLPREPCEHIYDRIVADLINAQELLTSYYPTDERVRPNKFTAKALLARIYLYMGNWEGAIKEASAVIDNGMYRLSDLSQTFLKESKETIWQLMPVFPYYNTIIGQQVLPSSPTRIPRFILTEDMVNAFEEDDRRKNEWVNSNIVSQEIYSYPYKYKVGSGSQLYEYLIVFRLAEQYLIRAEANARLGDLEKAQEDINTIRNRAGLGNTHARTFSELLATIERERRVELFTEWGDRWLYLKRSDRADDVLSLAPGVDWQNTDVLWPIPFEQIQLNPFLTQNKGY